MSLSLSKPSLVLPWRAFVVPAILVLLWGLLVASGKVNPLFLPPVSAVANRGWDLIKNGELWVGLSASLLRDLAGFAIASVIGVSLGVLLGVFRLADRLLLPSFNTLKQISPFALIPLMTFWFGVKEPAKIAFIVLTCVFPILLNTYQGVRSVSRDHIEVARLYGFGPWQLLRRVILPGAAPGIFAGLHLGVFFSWLGTVGAEYFLAAGAGIGNTIIDGRNSSQMDLVLVGVLVIGLTGYGLNVALSLIERRVLRWQTRKA